MLPITKPDNTVYLEAEIVASCCGMQVQELEFKPIVLMVVMSWESLCKHFFFEGTTL